MIQEAYTVNTEPKKTTNSSIVMGELILAFTIAQMRKAWITRNVTVPHLLQIQYRTLLFIIPSGLLFMTPSGLGVLILSVSTSIYVSSSELMVHDMFPTGPYNFTKAQLSVR
jgi:hypothetical protein